MRFLIINTDYSGFLTDLYASNSELAQASFDKQIEERYKTLFGVGNAYSKNLKKLGHEAYDIYFNNKFMQKEWAKEHETSVDQSINHYYSLKSKKDNYEGIKKDNFVKKIFSTVYPRIEADRRKTSLLEDILEEQIKYYSPDVIINQAMDGINCNFFKKIKPQIRLLVGQHAAPLNIHGDLSIYDLVISSLPNCVSFFRNMGVPSELNKLAFDPDVLQKIGTDVKPDIPVSFVGGLSHSHSKRIQWLEYLCKNQNIKIWGQGIETIPKNSLIRSNYVGSSWGIEMYNILARSKITLNCHINMAENYANNMRLYEATGIGTLLITDWKDNIADIFEVDKEIVAYRTPKECNELIHYYLENDEERQKIAKNGQQKTLNDHNYYKRMQEYLEIISKYI